VGCERFQHLHTFVVSSYGSERFVAVGFQQLASSVLIGCLTRRSSRRNERGAKFIASKGFDA